MLDKVCVDLEKSKLELEFCVEGLLTSLYVLGTLRTGIGES